MLNPLDCPQRKVTAFSSLIALCTPPRNSGLPGTVNLMKPFVNMRACCTSTAVIDASGIRRSPTPFRSIVNQSPSIATTPLVPFAYSSATPSLYSRIGVRQSTLL